MKYASLLLGLALCASAHADSITNLAGKIKQPGEVFVYQFEVQQFDEPGFILDVLNGQVITRAAAFDCHPCIATYINDFYEFLPTETIILAQFGNWNLVGSASGVSLVDPPALATPEPSTLVLFFFGALAIWLRALKPRKAATKLRDYVGHHSFRKV